MHSKLIVFVFCNYLVILINGPQCVKADFFKSFFPGRNADRKRAQEADRNFLKQVRTSVYAVGEIIVDSFDGREETPESFYKTILEPILDYTPIVGHFKAEIHAKMGDEWKSVETWDKANTLPIIIVKFAASLFKTILNFF